MASKPHTDEVHRKQRVVKNPIKFKITLNDEQKEAKAKILENTITMLAGKAGSGKTLLAVQVALDGLLRRHYEHRECVAHRRPHEGLVSGEGDPRSAAEAFDHGIA